MPLSADDIQHAFAALSDELDRRGKLAEIVVGGAALVLLFRARESTKDVDAYFLTPEASIIRDAAEVVANRLSRMTGSADDVWRTIKTFVPIHQLDKASYAFEDLWETLHGRS